MFKFQVLSIVLLFCGSSSHLYADNNMLENTLEFVNEYYQNCKDSADCSIDKDANRMHLKKQDFDQSHYQTSVCDGSGQVVVLKSKKKLGSLDVQYDQSGYSYNPSSGSCEDIDECSLGTHNCSDLCVNSAGSFSCESCPANSSASSGSCQCRTGFTGTLSYDHATSSWLGSCEEDLSFYRSTKFEMHERNPLIFIKYPRSARDTMYSKLKSWPIPFDMFDKGYGSTNNFDTDTNWWLKVYKVDSVRAGSSVGAHEFTGSPYGGGKDFLLTYVSNYTEWEGGSLASNNGGWGKPYADHNEQIVPGGNTVLYGVVLEFWYGKPGESGSHRLPIGSGSSFWQSGKKCSGSPLSSLDLSGKNAVQAFHACIGASGCACITTNDDTNFTAYSGSSLSSVSGYKSYLP